MERAEAIKIIKSTLYTPEEIKALETLIPELRESEDERMRQLIYSSIKNDMPIASPKNKELALSWLERQKEQKPITIVRIPKFRVGDIIQHVPLESWDSSKKIKAIDKDGYFFDSSHFGDNLRSGFIGFSFEDEYELVEQKPADDTAFEEWIDEWWKHNKVNNPDSYDKGDEIQFDERGFKNFCRGIRNMYAEQKPAEPSDEELQRHQDELTEFKKFATKQAKENQLHISYTRDVMWENFCSELLSFVNSRKPAEWSDEEKQKLNRIYSIIGWAMDEHAFSSCKKLIGDKEGVELQDFLRSIAKPKQEWSKEDEKEIDCIINVLDRLGFEEFCKSSRDQDIEEERFYYKEIQFLKRLKSLRPQPHWKPSEEQIKALLNAEGYLRAGLQHDSAKTIAELYEQLKQLM